MNGKECVALCLPVSLMLAFLSLSSVSSVTAAPQDAAIGVEVGDWAEYGEVIVEWNSTDPNATPDPELIAWNQTAWFRNVVTNIVSQQIYFEQVTQLKNDTPTTSNLYVNIGTGAGSGTLHYVPAELFAGDWLYPESLDVNPASVNETVLRESASVTRLVNHLNFETLDLSRPGETVSIAISYYWDRATGILTERRAAFVNQTTSYVTSWIRSDKIVDTNLWSGDETERPTANAGNNRVVYNGSSVEFDASASSDNTGIVSYQWLFGDGATGEGLVATHVYDHIGEYYAVLIVSDASGNMAFDAVGVVVQAPPSNGEEPPPQNGSELLAIGVVATIIVVVVVWLLWSRRKRRLKVRARPAKSRLTTRRQV